MEQVRLRVTVPGPHVFEQEDQTDHKAQRPLTEKKEKKKGNNVRNVAKRKGIIFVFIYLPIQVTSVSKPLANYFAFSFPFSILAESPSL